MNRGRISTQVFLCFLMMMFLMVIGCSKSDDTLPTYNISGAVTGATAVTINLTGAATASTTTDVSGNYSFTGQANGTYTVTPVKADYTFNPISTVVSVSGASVTGTNFVATTHPGSTYSISGTVSGAASSGVTITLSGANTGSVVTGVGGTYSIPGLVPGSYTVTPSPTGFTFNPTSIAVTITAANSTGNNFVATAIPTAHSISGTVTALGLPLSGVTITVTGTATATATTNASGVFNVTGLYDGNYTLTPSKTGYTFSPTSSAATVSGADIAGKDFVATINPVPTHSISGTVSGAVLSGVTITLSSADSPTTYTNTSGNYSFSRIVNGNYTVTPSKTGYTFSPANAAANVSGADVTVPNFVATPTGGSTGKIAFIASKDEAAHQRAVFVMNADGSNLTQLTNYSIGAQHPAWSPNGKKIAFASILDGGIYTINADGTNLTRIVYEPTYDEYTGALLYTSANDHPSWSPNGSVIVYESYRDNNSGTTLPNVNLYVVSSGGGMPTGLTSDLSAEEMPSWSPDGSKIAFAFFKYEGTNWGNYQILTMNADGSNWVQWTNSDITWNNQDPDWSPDGSKILFTGDGNDHQGIFCIDLGKATQTFVGANLGIHPKWSPDGTKFVTHGLDSISWLERIWITNADGSNTKKIETPTMDAYEPDWTSQ